MDPEEIEAKLASIEDEVDCAENYIEEKRHELSQDHLAAEEKRIATLRRQHDLLWEYQKALEEENEVTLWLARYDEFALREDVLHREAALALIRPRVDELERRVELTFLYN